MYKKVTIHVLAIIAIFIVSCVYFPKVFDGKELPMGDIQSYKGVSKESFDFYEQTGKHTAWNSSMFCGMPNYQLGMSIPQKNPWHSLQSILSPGKDTFGCTIGSLFFYLIGFYIALACLGLSPWLALLGALAFGLGSYQIIIIEAGHITKVHCMALMMPILAGMLLCFWSVRGVLLCRTYKGDVVAIKKDKIENTTTQGAMIDKRKTSFSWWGLVGGIILFTISLNLQLANNHIQITYYTAIGGVILGLTYLIYSVKERWLHQFFVTVGLLLVGCAFAVGCNARLLFVTADYAKYTMRGGSEITVNPTNLCNEEAPKSDLSASGLSIDYAYSWSYGIGETYTLLVPGAIGGGSGERVGKESACYQNFHQTQMPLYWGDQPFTSGPVYFGAIVCFLFVLGLFVVKGPERWWLLIATIVAVLLSWGRHFMGLNEWLFYNLPLYNKFRTPSMSLTLANVTMVLMAVLALKVIVDAMSGKNAATVASANKSKHTLTVSAIDIKRLNKALYWAGGIVVGILAIGLLLCGGFSYSGAADQEMAHQYGDQWQFIQDVFIQDRKALFVSDSWRSILFVVLAFAVLWLYINQKIKKSWIVIVALLAFVVVDLWNVDRRYLNDDNFVKTKDVELMPSQWDADIDAMAAQYGDEDYRVFNMAVNTFNDAKPAAFHHQIGGYCAVKLRRYQDIIDFYISRHINPNVLNMLNARYIVFDQGQVQRNPDALGNAWFVDSCRYVGSPDEEILALNDINPAVTAIVDTSKMKVLDIDMGVVFDSGDYIKEEFQKPYNPGYLKYNAHCSKDRLAVFSEVYYAPDWFCYIDGRRADYIRANYILRGVVVPAGNHVIEFRNEAPLVHRLNTISLVASIVLLVIVVVVVVVASLYVLKRKKCNKEIVLDSAR